MKSYSLYRHTSPSGKVYIGITTQIPEKRWYNGKGYKRHTYFFNAILKYGWDNIKHEVLFTGLDELTAKSLEIDLIRHYKGLGISYNITDGGDGYLGYKPSKGTRKIWSEQRSGRVLTKEWRDKISSTLKGRVFSREQILKGAESAKVKCSKAVIQFSKSGAFVAEYNSIREAANINNVCPGDIIKCCKGKQHYCGGFNWKYKYETEDCIISK